MTPTASPTTSPTGSTRMARPRGTVLANTGAVHHRRSLICIVLSLAGCGDDGQCRLVERSHGNWRDGVFETVYVFDAARRLMHSVAGHETEDESRMDYRWSAAGLVEQVFENATGTVRILYDEHGYAVSWTDGEQRVTYHNRYDAHGELVGREAGACESWTPSADRRRWTMRWSASDCDRPIVEKGYEVDTEGRVIHAWADWDIDGELEYEGRFTYLADGTRSDEWYDVVRGEWTTDNTVAVERDELGRPIVVSWYPQGIDAGGSPAEVTWIEYEDDCGGIAPPPYDGPHEHFRLPGTVQLQSEFSSF